MNKLAYLIIFAVLLFTACGEGEPTNHINEFPIVKSESSYTVLIDEDITYANGLSLDAMNTLTAKPQLLDV